MENRKKLTDTELDQISGGGGTIDDSDITELNIFKHFIPECNATFATPGKPCNCPACGRPDDPDNPTIREL